MQSDRIKASRNGRVPTRPTVARVFARPETIIPKLIDTRPDSRLSERPHNFSFSHDSVQRAIDSPSQTTDSPPTHLPAGAPTHRHASVAQTLPDSPHKKDHQEVRWKITSDEGKRPKATVHDRLNQARIFLSDEDVYLTPEFDIRHKQIDNYIRKLADDQIECDVGVYNEVQDMLRVHEARMKKLKNQGLEWTEHLPAASLSQRLSLGEIDAKTAIPGAPLRSDHPPFTTERPPNLNLFLRTLHSSGPHGQKLRKIESEGRQEVLRDPSVVNDVLEERDSASQDEAFEILARRRGRQRAATEIALRSFATNEEQHYQGGWQHNFLRPSRSVVRRPDSVLTISTGKENEGHYTPPYRWMKRYLAFREYQKRVRLSGAKEMTLQELSQPLSETHQVFSEARAVELIEDAILKELHENRPPRNIKSTHDWSLVSKSLDLAKTTDYFEPGRWRESPATSAEKRKAEETLVTEPSPKRSHFAVAYTPLGSPSDPPSRRLPPEELGFQAHSEDSRDHTPEIGAGNLMPSEIKQFDYSRDGAELENVPDRMEKHYPGEASFMFGETGYLSALMSREIAIGLQSARYSNRKWNLERGHKPAPIKNPPSPPPPLVLPSERFSLPPLERAQGYQGRFPLPPFSLDQPPPRPTTPTSPQRLPVPPPKPSLPRLSPSSQKSHSFLQIPHQAHESKDDPTASEMPPPLRSRPKLPPVTPLKPPIQLLPPKSKSPVPSKLRFAYNVSPKGKLSPHRLGPQRPRLDSGASFKIWDDSKKTGSEDSEVADEGKKWEEEKEVEQGQEDAETNQEQRKEEDEENEPSSESVRQEHILADDDDARRPRMDEDEDDGLGI